MELSDEFTSDCHVASAILASRLKYHATRFNQMLEEHGGVDTARRLIAMDGASDGFRVMWEAGRLDLSAEALAILPRYATLFTEDERVRARLALADRGFPVARYLEAAAQTRPPWKASPLRMR